MLKAKAEIQFTLEGREFVNKYIRPIFNFGEGLLFSGNIKSNQKVFKPQQRYAVDIDFFSIEDEAYDAVKPLLKDEMDLAIQEGAYRVIGIANITNFVYE